MIQGGVSRLCPLSPLKEKEQNLSNELNVFQIFIPIGLKHKLGMMLKKEHEPTNLHTYAFPG